MQQYCFSPLEKCLATVRSTHWKFQLGRKLQAVDGNSCTFDIFLNLSSIFDNLNHEFLMKKLRFAVQKVWYHNVYPLISHLFLLIMHDHHRPWLMLSRFEWVLIHISIQTRIEIQFCQFAFQNVTKNICSLNTTSRSLYSNLRTAWEGYYVSTWGGLAWF